MSGKASWDIEIIGTTTSIGHSNIILAVGHFNAAFVLGQMGDYEYAIREMKRYFALVPAAPNARAVQQRVYKWEHKASEQN